MRAFRDRLENGLAAGPAVIFSRDVERLPNTTLFAVPGLRAETAVITSISKALRFLGFRLLVGEGRPSHVLAAMGVPKGLVAGAIRVSIGPTTSENEIDFFSGLDEALAGLSKANAALPPEREPGSASLREGGARSRKVADFLTKVMRKSG